MAETVDTALRYARTLRHLRPVQVVGRVLAESRRKLGLIRLPALPVGLASLGLRPRTAFLAHDAQNDAHSIEAGRFTFLNETRDLGLPIDWTAPLASLLWQFNLHYLQYLHLLDPDGQRRLLRAWVAANPVGEGVGWHPYPTALRLLAVMKANLADDAIHYSLYRQATWLYRTLEVYHPGNHLLENARALVLAGRYFEGQGEAHRWYERGLSIYRRELPKQVLPDGGYFERSPMYHGLMLEGLLDVLNVLPDGHRDTALFTETAERMRDYLASILHPDGKIPLFNDSTLEIAPPANALLDYADRLLGSEPRKALHFPSTGRFILADGPSWVIVDGGPIGPDELPAHAHADIFSFEASFGGHRFIVDTGVFEYPAGSERTHDRSTAAHNTVGIDGVDQAECWASFRVARRYPPEDVVFTQDGVASSFSGTFRGYSRLIGDRLEHRRTMSLRDGTLSVEDHVTGEGSHDVESRLHLHPDVILTPDGDGFLLERDAVRVRLHIEGASVREEASRYSPGFGVALPNRRLVMVPDGPLPARLAYTLTPLP